MLWCDLAISATGLTKYELAATGTPAILLSHDRAHAENNLAFAELGAAVDLGEIALLSDITIAETVRALLQDAARRARMSSCGRRAAEGRGGFRSRQSVVVGTSGTVRVESGGRLIHKKKIKRSKT